MSRISAFHGNETIAVITDFNVIRKIVIQSQSGIMKGLLFQTDKLLFFIRIILFCFWKNMAGRNQSQREKKNLQR